LRHFTLHDRQTGDATFDGVEVRRGWRCPICGKDSWCLRDASRGLTICPWTPSSRQIGNAGYLHADSGVIETRVVAAFMSKPKPRPTKNFRPIADQCHLQNGGMAAQLAISLGVSEASIDRVKCGWSDPHQAWTFPMVDAKLQTVGIRLRSMDGFKYAMPDSHNALFVPTDLTGDGTLYIEEGPTSLAAVLDWGFDCIGRPSCSSCVDMTLEWIMEHGGGRKRNAVIIANKDTRKTRPDGSTFWPGQEGAAKLADRLHGNVRSVKVIEPLIGKDSRDWMTAGATRKSVNFVVNNVGYWQPGRAA
jgi:hypothetical protein